MESIYAEDLEVNGNEWRLRLCGGGLIMHLAFPAGYPDSEAPVASFEAAQGLPGFTEKLHRRLTGLWCQEVCAHEWAVAAAEEYEAAVGAGLEPPEDEGAGECSLPISPTLAEQVAASLLSAGFASCGPELFSHGSRGVTVEMLGGTLAINVDGISTEDLVDWVKLQLEEPRSFGAQLLDWTTAQRSAEPGFLEDEEVEGSEGFQFLPSVEELSVTSDRPLLIYTWGKVLRKAAPPDSQFNFNASVLNGRGGGADLRTQNGLSEEVQRNVCSCGLFPTWLRMVTSKIEGAGLDTVSINCSKGRHRSVAAAEILRSRYYPGATVKHLTIY